jgi:hypothetical protein
LPPLPFLQTRNDGFRCFASVLSLAALYGKYGVNAHALMHRFEYLAVHAPRDRRWAEREADALHAHTRYHNLDRRDRRAIYPRTARVDDLLALRAHEQIVFGPSLTHAVRCRIVATRHQAPAVPVPAQGELMPFPKPLAALLASLVAGCSAPPPLDLASVPMSPGDCGTGGKYGDPEGTEVACLGPHRFRLPSKLFNGHHQPWTDHTELGFVLDWPSLDPLPYGFDMYKDNNRFLAILGISVSYHERLSDEQFRVRPRRWIEPYDPSDPVQRATPSENLGLRIKGAPVHGLTPYYTDFDRLRRYYDELDGPGSPAAKPENLGNDDWFLDMGEDGIPRTVLKCSPPAIPDGVRMEHERMVKIPGVFRRAGCRHMFVLPEYKATVELSYQRMVMSDWQRIETRIRALLHQAEFE